MIFQYCFVLPPCAQVEMLRAYRSGQTDERTVRAIHLSINGLSAGLRNSG